jgi:hypothetical protein
MPPDRVRLDPDHAGWNDQVVGWASEARDDQGRSIAPADWPEYVTLAAAEAFGLAVAKAALERAVQVADRLFYPDETKISASIREAIRAIDPAEIIAEVKEGRGE